MNYNEQLKHPLWQRKRLEKMQEADWECEICKSGNEQLHVHHKRYEDGRLAWQYQNDELQCLCETCHALSHMNQRKVIRYAEKIGAEKTSIITFFGYQKQLDIELPENDNMMNELTDLRLEHALEIRPKELAFWEKVKDFKRRLYEKNNPTNKSKCPPWRKPTCD